MAIGFCSITRIVKCRACLRWLRWRRRDILTVSILLLLSRPPLLILLDVLDGVKSLFKLASRVAESADEEEDEMQLRAVYL